MQGACLIDDDDGALFQHRGRERALRILRLIGTVVGTTLLLTVAAPVTPADARPAAPAADSSLDPGVLDSTLRAVHQAGMYGVYSSVRDGDRQWTGASGVADVDTGRPVRPGLRHRVGSISKTFAAVAVLQQVERGRIRLDAPIGDYLP